MGAPLAGVTPQYFLNGAWVTAPIYAEDGPVQIERGYTDEGTIRPTKITMRVNDAADPSLNPSRPTSALYAITGRALPVQVLVGASTRGVVEVASMDPDETQDFNAAAGRGMRWLDLEAYGPLYRIGQWSDQLESTMTRQFSQYSTLIGFWPGEDAGLSTRVGLGRSATGFTFADADAPAGAAGSFLGTATSRAVFSPKIASTSAGFQVFFSTKLSAVPISPATTVFMQWRADNLLWSLEIDNIAIHLKLYINGALVDDSNTGLSPTDFTGWVSWRAKCYQSGGNVVCEFAWFGGDRVAWGITRTNAGTINRLTSIRIDGNALVAGTRYTQVGAVTTVVDDLQSAPVLQSFIGFAGETTVDRYNRLLTEAGIAHSVVGASSTLMGAQKPDTLINLLKEVGATEDGLIYDARSACVVTMRTRASRMNQTVAVTLDYNTTVVTPFKERLDNVGVQNAVTVEDRTGATAAAAKTTGAMSTAAYPAGIGVYKGGAFPDVNVNVFDAQLQLPQLASWLLARGTVPGPRFPTVTVEVGLKSPAVQAAVAAVNVGDRIQVTNRLPDPIDLQVIGVTEKIGVHTWTFTFTCIPHDVFNVGSEDSAAHLLDTYANTIITAPAPATTGTSMVVGSADPDDVWSTTSLPYPVRVAGEKMTVTAATAPALVSGTWRQTLTVTRSVNGVVKTQVAGTAVNVFQPIREAY